MSKGPRNQGRMPIKMDPKSLGRILKKMWSGNEVKVVLIILCVLVSAIAMVVAMSYIQELVDVILPNVANAYERYEDKNLALSAALNSKEMREFVVFIVKWGGMFFISVVASTVQAFLSVSVSQGTLKDIRHEMFSKMQYLPVSYFDQNKYGDIMSKYTNDVDTLENFITQTVPNFISSIITILALLVFMIINSYLLTIVVIVTLVLIMLASQTIISKSAKHFVERQKIIGKSNAYIEESMEGSRVVQVFNHQDTAIVEFGSINEEYRVEDTKANIFSNIVGPLTGNLVRMQYVLVALIGVLLCSSIVYSGSFSALYSIGSLIAFLTYANNFSGPISRLAEQVTNIARASAGAGRIYDLIDRAKETDNGYVTLVNYEQDENGQYYEVKENSHKWAWKHPHEADSTITYTPLEGRIVLEDVDFGYREDNEILHDINIFAEKGQRIALVGETGAGKTTITNLINRFYDIEDGKIRYDGININKIKKDDLRKSLGLVLQDTNLFTGTIKENIKLGKPDATDDEVVAAAKIANADSFIRMMPEGYDTILTKAGENLSQGQRQLLAIARAAIADCPVLILDEATSSIDTRTELIVQQGMDKLMEGRTVFVIAHRLSTIQKSDVIMVLDHGRIIERGNHKQLIEKQGVYYQLYTGAFELE